MIKILQRIETYVLYAVVFLLPLLILPISPNPFVPAKLLLLSVGVAVVLLLKSARVIATGKLEFRTTSLDLPVALIALAYILSTIFASPNKMESLLLPGTTTAVVAGALLYFLLNQLRKTEKAIAGKLLFYSATIFSVVLLLAFSGLFNSIPQLPAYLRASSFNTAAGYLPAAIFLLVTLPVGVGMLFAEKVVTRRALLGVSSAIVFLALVVAIFNMLPGKDLSPRFPSVAISWSVSIDSLKESPIIGVGSGNYLTAFSRYRPIEYNATEIWPLKFTTANSYYLTAFTETGLLGIAALLFLLIVFGKGAYKDYKEKRAVKWGTNVTLVSTGLLLLLLLFFPATVLLISVLFILLSLSSETRKSAFNLTTATVEGASASKVSSRLPAILVTLPVIILSALFLYRASVVMAAEYTFKRAVDALNRNEATQTYDLLQKAININPTVDRYHATYAQVNLALANSIAGNEEITDTDRQNIAQLIQQAIREGKSTVALNVFRAANWELLARIYQAIIPFAQGADAFALQTMRQAVALDPINPNLRIAHGGILYGVGDFDGSVRVYELAVIAKPDHPNGHYNLAFALREVGKIELAIDQMTIVLGLLDRSSPDYNVARQALEDLEALRATAQPPVGQNLIPPQPGEEPILEPPLDLPEESEPPEAPITPTPVEGEEETTGTPSVSPEPTPTP